MWGEGGLYKQVCDSGEFVGREGREREGEGEGEGERERDRERERERGMEREGEGGGGTVGIRGQFMFSF